MKITRQETQHQPLEAPISLKSAASFIAETGDDVIDSMAAAASEIATGSAKMADSWNTILADKLETPARNMVRAKAAIQKSWDRIAPRIDRATANAETALVHLRASMQPKAPTNGVEAIYAGECRAALLRLPEDARGREVERAIAEGDDAFVAAALTGSLRLTGLGPAQRDALLDLHRRTRHAETSARVEKIAAAFARLDRLAAMYRDWFTSIGREDDAAVQAAERSARLAQEALANA